MSVADRTLLFTSRAERDIRHALLDTRRQWGSGQRRIYRRKLNDAMALILDNPEIGLARPELGPAVRSRLVERHMISCEILDQAVLMVRVMHVRMSPPAQPGNLAGA